MTISLAHVNTQSTRVFMGTLTAEEYIHDALAKIAKKENIQAATFELLGGITSVELSEYNFHTRERNPSLFYFRSLEILSGHGTISLLDGEPYVHLHLTLSYQDEEANHAGVVVIGGHASSAKAFAVEFTLTAYDGVSVNRSMHEGTGLKLWDLPPFNN
ncbi:MAG: hypothetical protein RIR73_2458 [Chloroflexota bacterium]